MIKKEKAKIKSKHTRSVPNVFKPTLYILKRINLIIFIVVVVIGLIAAVLTLTNIMQVSTDNNPLSDTNSTQVDQTTINKLIRLKTSNNNTGNQTLPSGRVDPFAD